MGKKNKRIVLASVVAPAVVIAAAVAISKKQAQKQHK